MPERLNAVAFTQGAVVPSSRFRVQQYLPLLSEQGISVRESPAAYGSYPRGEGFARIPWLMAAMGERARAALRSQDADIVWLQREMVSTLYSAERLLRGPLVFDVDDAIWLTQRWGGIDSLARHSRIVMCGNAHIAEHFASFASVRIVPTGVDTRIWQPGTPSEQPVVVWSGSAAGLPYLYEIENALAAVLEAVPGARLRVVSNAKPRFKHIAADRLEILEWSPKIEVAAVQSAWVGVMPMPDTEWTRGKCSFKMLTYLACGVPAVASPWGMNAEVISGGGAIGAARYAEWVEALVALLRDGNGAQGLGAMGRAQVVGHYATAVIAPLIAQALRDAAQ